jgi:hypothetical protein
MTEEDDAIECPEVTGKTIRVLKIYRDPIEGTEMHIDFSDGTSFSCCVAARQSTEASLVVCGGPGEPEVLHRYEFD